MNNLIKYIGLLIIPFCLMFASCDSDPDYPDTTANETVIQKIKIINGGLSGTETIVGTVNENTKEISFPEVHMESDLSHVKFEIEASDRAHLDSTEYNFVVVEGATQRKRVIKLVNGTRYREYFTTIRLDVPVWGADFTPGKVKVYDYSGATPDLTQYAGGLDMPMYKGNAAEHGRQYGLSLQNVLVASRPGVGFPELLKLSDLKNGTITSTPLVGYNSGWFGVNGGTIVNDHIYLCNGAGASISFDVWEEAHPELPPTRITNARVATPNTTVSAADNIGGYGTRYEGFVSADIDTDGNGYLFTHSGTNGTTGIIRAKVSGFKNLDEVSLLPSATPHPGAWSSLNRVPGTNNEYIYSGWSAGGVKLVDSGASIQYEIPTSLISSGVSAMGIDAKIVSFNKERYLITMGNGAGIFSVYDITQGATTKAALELLNAKTPLFTYSLGGTIPNGNCSVTTAWIADGDNTLYLLAGGVQAGFAVFEIPKKVKESK